MRNIFGVLFAVLLIGCGDAVSTDVICRGCGDGSITCNGPIQDCIGADHCDTHGPGDLILNADGTYHQTYSDGSTQDGTYIISDGAVMMDSGGLIPVLVNVCPFD